MKILLSLFALAFLAPAAHSAEWNADDLNISEDVQTYRGHRGPHRPYPGRRPGYRPGRPGPVHPGYPYPAPAWQTCYAVDANGAVFYFTGSSFDGYVQGNALHVCRMNSFFPYSCRPTGCRY